MKTKHLLKSVRSVLAICHDTILDLPDCHYQATKDDWNSLEWARREALLAIRLIDRELKGKKK